MHVNIDMLTVSGTEAVVPEAMAIVEAPDHVALYAGVHFPWCEGDHLPWWTRAMSPGSRPRRLASRRRIPLTLVAAKRACCSCWLLIDAFREMAILKWRSSRDNDFIYVQSGPT